jgi:pimeloyl-ACP methyl ester carboxylesterase
MPFVELTDVRLAYERLDPAEDNDLTPVVLIHGLGANLAFWYWGVARPLAQRYPVIAYDLRGHGRSDLSPRGYTPETMAADLLALLDRLEISSAHLVGHSFGGAVALHTSVPHSHRVSSLALVDVILRAFQPQPRLADCPNWERLRESYSEVGVELSGDEAVDFHLLEALADRKQRLGQRTSRDSTVFLPFESWNGSRRAAGRWRRLLSETSLIEDVKESSATPRDAIAGLRLPMMAAYGEFTYAMPSLQGLAAVQPYIRQTVVPGAGHFFPALAPQPLVDAVNDFLRSSPVRADSATVRAAERI